MAGVLYFVGFAGIDVWPLSFCALVPLLVALRGQTPKRGAWLGFVTGTTLSVGGFYWLQQMLQTFSGFPTLACAFFTFVLCSYQGGRLALMGWLYARAEGRGWPRAPVFAAAFVASELLYPLLFPWYFGASVHQIPQLMQVAELGGPLLVGLVLVGVNLALAELVTARLDRRRPCKKVLLVGAGGLACSFLYGIVRLPMVDKRAREAESLHVGVVQGNMGLMQKREDPGEGLRRHLRLTQELKEKGVELVVWSESSVTFAVNERMYGPFMQDRIGRKLGVPAIFGGVIYRTSPDNDPTKERWFNTALATNREGAVTGRYDKQFLLAFGEKLPFGETFPILHKWSPHSGRFSQGTSMDSLKVDIGGKTRSITTLICYEDILPGFANALVNHGDPELLVNITNDAWFGDTTEPWEHLALAQFRAIEHRRYLVRSTNSGVSAVIDSAGRVLSHTPTFQPARLDETVHFLRGKTVYEVLGDIPWYLLALASFAGAFVAKRRGSTGEKAPKAPSPPLSPPPPPPPSDLREGGPAG